MPAGRRSGPNRVLGPYRVRDGWVYHVITNGVRHSYRTRAGATEEDARGAVRDAIAALEPLPEWTVEEAVTEYANHIYRRTGNGESVSFEKAALAPLVEACGGAMVGKLNVGHLDAYLRALETKKAMATRRSYWKALVRFVAWVRRRTLLPRDIVAECLRRRERLEEPLPWKTPAGKRALGRGKPQLRNMAEVEAYLKEALALDHPETAPKKEWVRIAAERRVGACLPLLSGLASGEVRHLRVGDIDLEAGIGFVRDDESADDGWNVKTANRVGEFEIPDVLRVDLELLTRNRAPHEWLLHDAEGHPHERSWLRDLVVEVCGKAKVEGQPIRVVNPHGLRGTHATLLRVLMRRRIGDIAEALRHGDQGQVAGRHYVGAPERRQALIVIKGGKDEKKEAGNG